MYLPNTDAGVENLIGLEYQRAELRSVRAHN